MFGNSSEERQFVKPYESLRLSRVKKAKRGAIYFRLNNPMTIPMIESYARQLLQP